MDNEKTEKDKLMAEYGQLELQRRSLIAQEQLVRQRQEQLQAKIFADGPVKIKLPTKKNNGK